MTVAVTGKVIPFPRTYNSPAGAAPIPANVGRCFIVCVKGNSMEDLGISDGDLLVATREGAVCDQDIIIARLNDELYVKRARIKGAGVTVSLAEDPVVIGKAVYRITKLEDSGHDGK